MRRQCEVCAREEEEQNTPLHPLPSAPPARPIKLKMARVSQGSAVMKEVKSRVEAAQRLVPP